MYQELAKANGAALVPFLLERVGGVPALNQADGIHPTAAGQRIMAETVWRVLGPVLTQTETGGSKQTDRVSRAGKR